MAETSSTAIGSTRILGISAFDHDSAVALIVDGKIVAAAQEERFTRKKHDHHFPINAIEYCLREARITPVDLDAVLKWLKAKQRLQNVPNRSSDVCGQRKSLVYACEDEL